jgi:anti-anti-sigma regulatory factor
VIEFVDYIDSTGLGQFIAACVNLARQGHNIVLLHPDAHARSASATKRIDRLIRMAGAKNDIRVFRDEESALAAVAASANPHKTPDTHEP